MTVTSGLVTSGLVTSGLVTSGLVTSGLVTSGLVTWKVTATLFTRGSLRFHLIKSCL
ncbi:MAG: hypothetical protein KDB11_12635 [Planctomycetales bacterium]|nr:hypothetical protein [Planctomycetales bacterium]